MTIITVPQLVHFGAFFLPWKWYFVTKIVLTYCGKKLFSITRTICSNSERSEQFLVIELNAFLTYSWRFLRSKKLEQLKFKLEKNIGI